MPAVAFNGSETNDVMTYDIYYRVWDSCHHTTGFPPRCVGGYWYYDDGASTISGTVNASSSNVFINGKPIARQDDDVVETEVPHVSGEPLSNHTGGTGKVTFGNSNNVYVGGKLVASVGSQVQTHSSPTTTIKSGSANVFVGG